MISYRFFIQLKKIEEKELICLMETSRNINHKAKSIKMLKCSRELSGFKNLSNHSLYSNHIRRNSTATLICAKKLHKTLQMAVRVTIKKNLLTASA